jgi:hypothetical protein
MNEDQILAIRCACADLIGALQARNQLDIHAHDWKGHELSIDGLINTFDFLSDFAEDDRGSRD